MRNIGLAFLASVLLILLAIYITNTLSPWNQEAVTAAIEQYELADMEQFQEFLHEIFELGLIWDLLDFRNFLSWLFIIGLAFTSSFTAMHMLFDKLFFKKFFEKPRIFPAIRRGTLVYLALIGLVILRLLAGLFWYNALAVIVLLAALEIVLHHFFDSKPQTITDEQQTQPSRT